MWPFLINLNSFVHSLFNQMPRQFPVWRVVYEMIHIWTADIYEGDMWSSQWISNLSNWNEEAWKKSGLQRDSNPWPPRYRCDALPTELWSHTLGARSIVSSYFPVKGVKWRVVYEMIHIWTADIYEGDMWSSQWISNLSNWNEEAWKKKSGLQRDSNPWPPRYRCDALPTELWSHTLGARSIVNFNNNQHRKLHEEHVQSFCSFSRDFEHLLLFSFQPVRYVWAFDVTFSHLQPSLGTGFCNGGRKSSELNVKMTSDVRNGLKFGKMNKDV